MFSSLTDSDSDHAEADSQDIAPGTTPDPSARPIRSYVRRPGRIGSGQKRALANLTASHVLAYQPSMLDCAGVFGRVAPVVFEIGFGMGDATAQIALAQPELDFLGLEVHEPGVGALLQRIDQQQISNLRIIQHDAVEVLQQMIAPASLARVHIYFPDPWPKKRHHKRRLIQPDFVELVASRMAPQAILHCATDWQDYADQMLAVLSAAPTLVNTVAGFAPKPESRPLTKFEARGLRLGHGVWDLLFARR
jgi:tRNA (guanine-N7-)-methyltransferase